MTVDANAILKAVDEIAELEAQLTARRSALKGATATALKQRRVQITEALRLKSIDGDGWRVASRRTERNYMLDQIAKAHAGGRVTIEGLDA